MKNKFLLAALVLSAVLGLKISAERDPISPLRQPGQSEQDRFDDQEITQIMFGKYLERDLPLYSLEDRCPTSPVKPADRCPTPPTPELNK